MVNFNDPSVVVNDVSALRTFYLITEGIFFWEFFTTLGYELSIIRGRRSYRWTIWPWTEWQLGQIYSFTRIGALVMVILNLIYISPRTPINCGIWIKFQVLFGYFSIAAASLLIVIRIIAIWNKNMFVVVIATSVWTTNIVASGLGVSRLRSDWDFALVQCIVLNSDSSKLNIIVLLITDSVLLLTVLVGLLRLRRDGLGTSGLGRLLWNQGALWLLVATIAEVPPAVFIIMNLNSTVVFFRVCQPRRTEILPKISAPFNLMFQLPSVITMSIAATRMYRSLTDFVSGSTDIASDNLPKIEGKVSTLKWKQSAPIAFNRIEVTTVDTTTDEQYQISQTSRHDVCKSTRERSCDQHDGYELRQQAGETV